MKKLLLMIAASAIAVSAVQGQTNLTIDNSAMNLGYVNFSELPSNGGGFVFGAPWGLPDLTVEQTGSTFGKMGATQVGDGDPFWIVGGTGGPGVFPAPGSAYDGNKIAEATWFAEVGDGSLAGQVLTFEVNITEFSLTGGYTAALAIKESALGFGGPQTAITGTGNLSVSVTVDSAPGNVVQYGIVMVGPNVVPGDQFRYGSVTATAVPEPSTFALLGGLLALGFVMYRRRK